MSDLRIQSTALDSDDAEDTDVASPSSIGREITPEMQIAAELQIEEQQRIIDYDTREYPVEVIVKKYLEHKEQDENDFYIPDYQREYTWSLEFRCRFIESILMGLPIALLYVADVMGKEGRAEIVDGSQRVRTLADFMNNKLRLTGLKKLNKLNGFTYSDLPPKRQRRFGRHTLRMIELREGIDEETRREIFGRVNTSSLTLNDMEVRWGTSDSPYLKFVRECSEVPLFATLAPLGEKAIKLRDREEFTLRFFAYLDNYQGFDRMVVSFLNEYLAKMKSEFNDEARTRYLSEWNRMLQFVSRHFPNGFSRGSGHSRTPRVRFEALSVGSALALRQQPDLIPSSMAWLESEAFLSQMRADNSNSRPKIIRRIEFVRDSLLGKLQ